MQNFTWTERTLYDPVDIQINYHDTKCSDYNGPLVAMDLFYRQAVNILYGPCCKYVLSPVGRYAKHWGLPIITPGGQAKPFSNRTNFESVTRFMPPYEKLMDFLKTYLIDRYNWTNLGLLYTENLKERKALGYSPCAHMLETIRQFLERKSNISSSTADAQNQSETNSSSTEGRSTRDYKFVADLFDENDFNKFLWNDILNEIQNNSRSKFQLYYNDDVSYQTFRSMNHSYYSNNRHQVWYLKESLAKTSSGETTKKVCKK